MTTIVLAIGSLGTAAYGVVDASKGFGGGMSNFGFGDIKKVISSLIPFRPEDSVSASALGRESVLATLRANWLNGMALADQKSIAKALVKLNLTATSAAGMAAATGVDPALLASVAAKLVTGAALTQQETDAYGRFDLLLSALLDQGYQRGDQRYRNSAKLVAIPVAVGLAVLGALAIDGSNFGAASAGKAVIAGLLATPLAPVAKDLSSAIQAGAKVAQAWKK
ncbi:MAG TPA: hypothetical protein VEL75_21680 [Candidatus Methylomirabilis sp.]|nr:hypothetical protein [Candidatus Methylomirabilis sp.]